MERLSFAPWFGPDDRIRQDDSGIVSNGFSFGTQDKPLKRFSVYFSFLSPG
jgi:hypothetical protein